MMAERIDHGGKRRPSQKTSIMAEIDGTCGLDRIESDWIGLDSWG